jgi:hypothetical protein
LRTRSSRVNTHGQVDAVGGGVAVAGAELALVIVSTCRALFWLHAVPVWAAAHKATDCVLALTRAAQIWNLYIGVIKYVFKQDRHQNICFHNFKYFDIHDISRVIYINLALLL